MRSCHLIGSIAAVGLLFAGNAVRASPISTYTYVFGAGGGSTTDISMSVGGTIDVPLYLQETFDLSGGSFIDSEGGLATSTFQVLRTAGPGSPVDLQSLTAPGTYGAVDNSGALGDLTVISAGGTSAYTQDGGGSSATIATAPDQATVFYFPSTGNIIGTISGNTYTILLGTFHFQAGSDPSTTTFMATDDDPSTYGTATAASFTPLDAGDGNPSSSQIHDSTLNINVTTQISIPEPATGALLGGTTLAIGAMGRRTRR